MYVQNILGRCEPSIFFWAQYFFLNYRKKLHSVILPECFRNSWSPRTILCVSEISFLLFEVQQHCSQSMARGSRGWAWLWKHYDDIAPSFTLQINCDISFKTYGAIKEGIPGYSSSDKYTGQTLWKKDFQNYLRNTRAVGRLLLSKEQGEGRGGFRNFWFYQCWLSHLCLCSCLKAEPSWGTAGFTPASTCCTAIRAQIPLVLRI